MNNPDTNSHQRLSSFTTRRLLKLLRNQARHNGSNGIIVSNADDTLVSQNTAQSNASFDLNDSRADCGTNTWQKNTFDTKNQGCIQ
jgi:parallel beta-helix repeat protein